MVPSVVLVIGVQVMGVLLITLAVFMLGWFTRSYFVEDERVNRKRRLCKHRGWIVVCKGCGTEMKEVIYNDNKDSNR